ncbi:Mur ligase family protein [Lactobacillaceae bacterium L1_55_11]|nr:Mur ligase family protein [Lactobacillaceae bacterium L1_55_11]
MSAATRYQRALDRLAAIPAGMRYEVGEQRIAFLCQILVYLGFDQLTGTIIRVAGTNGKGSTSAMTGQVLQAAGYSVGVFSSPFLFEVTEEINYNGTMIGQEAFADALERLETVLDEHDLTLTGDISEFEATFLVAMAFYIKQNPDYLVLEVGLGGEFDATNAVPRSDYAIFTRIGLDHTQILGDTVTKIAQTKMNMIRPGETVVNYANQRPAVNQVLETIASQRHNPVVSASAVTLTKVDRQADATYIDLTVKDVTITNLALKLRGEYQLENLKTVVALWYYWTHAKHLPISEDDLKAGIANSQIAGRFEVLRTKPNYFIVDGAHNPDGIGALIDTLNRNFADYRKVLIVGFLADKDTVRLVQDLAALSDTAFIVTTPANEERQLQADQLYDQLTKFVDARQVVSIPDPVEAVNYANQHFQDANDVIVGTGSFYLVKEVIRAVRALPENPS